MKDFYKFKFLEKELLLPLILIGILVFLSMFSGWEMGDETWGYWYFARVFEETKTFILMDRSPLYVLYISLFNVFEYPYNVNFEYFLTTFLCVVTLFFFFSKFLNVYLSLISSSVWIPVLQLYEPPVQKLALAVSIVAILIRWNSKKNSNIYFSYFFLILAYLFRQTYLVFILGFLCVDFYNFYQNRRIKEFFTEFFNIKYILPYLFLIITVLIIILRQSSLPWNNVWVSDTNWFPNNGKSMLNGGGLHMINHIYMLLNFEDKTLIQDYNMYFTNRDIFNSATTFLEAIKSNPRFFIFEFFPLNVKLWILSFIENSFIPFKIIKVLATIFVLYTSYIVSLRLKIFNFWFATLMVLLVLMIAMPKARYMLPAIPLFILSIYWIQEKFNDIFKRFVNDRINLNWISSLIFVTFLIIFSFNNIIIWKDTVLRFLDNEKSFKSRILTNEKFSMQHSVQEINTLVKDCDGLLSFESKFYGSFLDFPQNKIYSLYEIPPFGDFNNSEYKGLNTKRINCLLVSKNFSNAVNDIRIKNYVYPFIDKIVVDGAIKTSIPNYGIFYYIDN